MKGKSLKISAVKTLLFVLFSIQMSYAQVGIGTTDPQADLHIAGNTSTIRIDGLNATNNVNNDGTNLESLYVDSNGELTLTNRPSTEFLLNLDSVLGTARYEVDTGSEGQYRQEELYASPSFTITRNAIITITYGLGLSIEDYNGNGGNGTSVSDGKPKLYRTFFYIGDGTIPNTNQPYARVSHMYTNTIDAGPINELVLSGFIYVNATEHIYLTPGTYSIHLWGAAASNIGSNANGNAVTSDAFTIAFGNGSDSYLRIMANYIN